MPKNVKITTFPGPLDLLAPHSCMGCGHIGNPLCDRCKKYIISCHTNLCPNCKTKLTSNHCPNCPDLPPTFIVGERSDLLDAIIHHYKYNSARTFAKPLAEILDSLLPNFTNPTVIVPLPTISQHIRTRGFDHTRLIAKHLAKLHHCQTKSLLTRATNTIQVGTDRSTRIKQASTAYQLKTPTPLDPNATYLLLDDVWTTGASMRTAIHLLRSAGANKLAIAILALSRI